MCHFQTFFSNSQSFIYKYTLIHRTDVEGAKAYVYLLYSCGIIDWPLCWKIPEAKPGHKKRNCQRLRPSYRTLHPASRNWPITRATSSGDAGGVSAS